MTPPAKKQAADPTEQTLGYEQARDELWPHYRDMLTRIGRERGWAAPTRAHFEADAVDGSIYVGSPETVARKIASIVKVLGADRFDLK